MKYLLILFSFFLLPFAAQAQDDCECDFDPTADFICATDDDGNVFPVPNECFAECWGLTIVEDECDGWEGEWDDCDCEVTDEDFICVLTDEASGLICPFPNLCFAECAGYDETDVVDCGDWDTDWGDGWSDCDCETSDEDDYICATDEYGWIFPVPNECFAECWGLTVVEGECDDWDTGGEWPDGEGDCDCEITDEDAYVCAEDGFGFVFPVPNECFAECWGLTVVEGECDDWDTGGEWPSEDDCDCEITDEDEFICVLTDAEIGLICPFPNLCFAECAGYSEADIVECEDWTGDFPDDGTIDCLEGCFEEEENPVCVVDPFSEAIFELPNACIADCLGLEIIDCSEANSESTNTSGVTAHRDLATFVGTANTNNLQSDSPNLTQQSLTLYPNPAHSNLTVELNATIASTAIISINDYTGKIVSSQKYNLSKGINTENINIENLTDGIYQLLIHSNDEIIRSKFIKL